ncbi:MAG: hypothetical protein M3512_06625 [Bacteroidota bacterium]|nr:hypothetical protein [Bacteroidota bacterium]
MSMKTDKEFDDFFKNRFLDFEGEPPEGSWEKISPKIKKTSHLPIKKGIVAVLSLIVLSSLTYFGISFYKNGSIEQEQTINKSKDPQLQNQFKEITPTLRQEDTQKNVVEMPFSENLFGNEENTNKIKSSPNEPFENKNLNPSPEKIISESKDLTNVEVALEIEDLDGERHKNELTSLGLYDKKENPVGANDIETNKIGEHELDPVKEIIKEFDINVLETQVPNFQIEKPIFAGDSIEQHDEEEITPLKNLDENFKENNNEKHQKKNYIKAYFSPRYSLRRISPNTEDNIFVERVQGMDNHFGERFGFETGVSLERYLNKKWSLHFGLAFISMNEKLNFIAQEKRADSLQIISNIDNNTFELGNMVHETDLIYNSKFYYTGISIGSYYYLWSNRKKAFYISMGGGINLLIKGKIDIVKDGVVTSIITFPSPENPLEQMNFRINIAPGYIYKINPKLQVLIEPTLNYYLGSTFNNREPVGIKPYTIGLNFGIRL